MNANDVSLDELKTKREQAQALAQALKAKHTITYPAEEGDVEVTEWTNPNAKLIHDSLLWKVRLLDRQIEEYTPEEPQP